MVSVFGGIRKLVASGFGGTNHPILDVIETVDTIIDSPCIQAIDFSMGEI